VFGLDKRNFHEETAMIMVIWNLVDLYFIVLGELGGVSSIQRNLNQKPSQIHS